MHLVDQARFQILPDGRDTTADANIFATCGLARAVQSLLNAAGNEVKGRAAEHLQRLPRMMCEHEHRHVIGRRVTPPALPALVAPTAAHRPEHVAAEDPCPDILESAHCKAVVDAFFAALATLHLAKEARGKRPLVQRHPAFAHRILQALVRPCAEAICRKTKTTNSYFTHHTPDNSEIQRLEPHSFVLPSFRSLKGAAPTARIPPPAYAGAGPGSMCARAFRSRTSRRWRA